MKKLKPKKCRHCKEQFTPCNSLQVVCSPLCAIEYDKAKKAKKAKKASQDAKKAHRDDLKRFRDNDIAFQLSKAQAEFNRFIRLRDKDEPCISCGRHHKGQYHAGHYRSIGATKGLAINGVPLRFHEDNNHKQCSACNNHKSGNILEYRIRLIQKIGIERVEAIEQCHDRKKLTCEDVIAIREQYKQKCKEEE